MTSKTSLPSLRRIRWRFFGVAAAAARERQTPTSTSKVCRSCLFTSSRFTSFTLVLGDAACYPTANRSENVCEADTRPDIPSDIPSDVPSDIPSDIPSDNPPVIPSDVPSDIPTCPLPATISGAKCVDGRWEWQENRTLEVVGEPVEIFVPFMVHGNMSIIGQLGATVGSNLNISGSLLISSSLSVLPQAQLVIGGSPLPTVTPSLFVASIGSLIIAPGSVLSMRPTSNNTLPLIVSGCVDLSGRLFVNVSSNLPTRQLPVRLFPRMPRRY